MKLEMPGGGHITFSDEDERAIKILSGYGYSFDVSGKLTISDQKENPDFDVILAKLDTGTAPPSDYQSVLAWLTRRALKEKL